MIQLFAIGVAARQELNIGTTIGAVLAAMFIATLVFLILRRSEDDTMLLEDQPQRPHNSKIPFKPLPWCCAKCGKRDAALPASIPYICKVRYDRMIYDIAVQELSVLRCDTCGELLFTTKSDEQISRAMREQLGLLQPEEITKHIIKYNINHSVLAKSMGIDENDIIRWETGLEIQSRSADTSLRRIFKELRGL